MRMKLHEADFVTCKSRPVVTIDVDVQDSNRDEQVRKSVKNPHNFPLRFAWEKINGRMLCRIITDIQDKSIVYGFSLEVA